MNSAHDKSLARIKIHPAMIIITSVGVGAIAGNFWQLDMAEENLLIIRRFGLAFAGIGLLVLVLAYASMARANTTINPSEHSSKLVSSGIYAYSRNPIYLGWFVVLVGMGLTNTSFLALIVSLLMIFLLYWLVIVEEESYLESKFGEEYLQYKKNVRRWL